MNRRRMKRPIRRLMLFLLVLHASSTWAEADEAPLELDPIVVQATKRPTALSEVAGQISVIDAAGLQATVTESLDQVVRYEPGVDISTGSTRFGGDGFVIRGVGGNRVAIEVDGVPLRNGFAIGSYSNAGRLLVEPDRIKRLEILHGPASVLFGSDALGGVLAFTTWDPDDLLARGDAADDGARYFGLRAGWQSPNEAWVTSGQAALGAGAHGLLLSATVRNGHELDSAAVDRDDLDPQSWRSRDGAARYTFDTASGDRLRVDLSRFERDTNTTVRSLLGFGRFRNTTALAGDDRDETTRLFLDWDAHPGWLDGAVSRGYYVDSETQQDTVELREAASDPVRLDRRFTLDTRLMGIELQGWRDVAWGSSDHRLAAGFEWLGTRLEELRDGLETHLTTGESSKTLLGESLPTRDFPVSDTRELGIFLEDVITFGDARWELIPGLRYEHYSVEPKTDAIYNGAFPETPLVSVDEDRITPRIALRRSFGGGWSAYGQFTEGFRAPPVEDVNIGFEIPRFRFRALSNPELESETSRGYELGLRQFTATRRLSLTWFDTRFENLIESRALVGFEPASGYLIFQSRNIGEARIRGWDLRWDQELGAFSRRLERWTLRVAAYHARGDNETDQQPLNTISPPQAVLGLAWTSADERFDATLNAVFTKAQDRVDETAGARFAPGNWRTVDLAASWRLHPRFTLRATVTNLFDETYWRWQDVRQLAPDDPMIPLLARPGRGVSLSAQWRAW